MYTKETQALKRLKELLPTPRGTQEQIDSANCGLYHFNDCLRLVEFLIEKEIKNYKKL